MPRPINSQQMAAVLLQKDTCYVDDDNVTMVVRQLLVPDENHGAWLVGHLKEKITETIENAYESIAILHEHCPDVLPQDLLTPDLSDKSARKAFLKRLEEPKLKKEIDAAEFDYACRDDVMDYPSIITDVRLIELYEEGCEQIPKMGHALSALARSGNPISPEDLAGGMRIIKLLAHSSSVADRIASTLQEPANGFAESAITLGILHDDLKKIAAATQREHGTESSGQPDRGIT